MSSNFDKSNEDIFFIIHDKNQSHIESDSEELEENEYEEQKLFETEKNKKFYNKKQIKEACKSIKACLENIDFRMYPEEIQEINVLVNSILRYNKK